jgi:hypothetical protein
LLILAFPDTISTYPQQEGICLVAAGATTGNLVVPVLQVAPLLVRGPGPVEAGLQRSTPNAISAKKLLSIVPTR